MLSTSIDRVQVTVPLDPYLSLRAAASYSGLSVRNLRNWISNQEHPLPCYRVNGKILLRRSDLDHWLAKFRHVGKSEIDAMVDDILGEFRGESNTESGGQTSQRHRNTSPIVTARKRVVGGLHKCPVQGEE